MKRLSAAAALGVLASLVIGGIASAGSKESAEPKEQITITVLSDSVTVNGDPVDVPVKVEDADGRPVAGALLRLTVPVEFLGKLRDEIVGEATTDDAGEATLQFVPAHTGDIEATVAFWGDRRYAPSHAAIAFDVKRPAVVYEPEVTGLQARWARSYLILVPFVAIWMTYLLVVWLGVHVRRAGLQTKDVGTS